MYRTNQSDMVPNSHTKIICPSCGCFNTETNKIIEEIEPDDYMKSLGFKKYRCHNVRFKGLPCIMWFRKVS